jgi:hypothetical protein
MKFVTVRQLSLMASVALTIRFLSHDWCWVRTEPPSIERHRVAYLNWLFYLQILSTPNHCHMDLWLARLVLTHHHRHHHQQLPSSPSPREGVSSSFLLAGKCFFGRLTFASVQLGLELFSSSPLEWIPTRVALYLSLLAPVWLPRIPSHWSGSRTVPLTLVFRLLAFAELWLYQISLPLLIILRTIWSEWTRLGGFPLACRRMSLERNSRNP